MSLASLLDAALEAPVVSSFTRVGYDVRSRLAHWTKLDDYDLRGRTVVVTGASSGLGLVAAEQFARCGATVVLLGRDTAKTTKVRDGIALRTGNPSLSVVTADTGDLQAVRAAAAEIIERCPRLDVLVHNAGALTADRRESAQGIEQTVASQVVGPFLLTGSLSLKTLTARWA